MTRIPPLEVRGHVKYLPDDEGEDKPDKLVDYRHERERSEGGDILWRESSHHQAGHEGGRPRFFCQLRPAMPDSRDSGCSHLERTAGETFPVV